jgi:hypothetical protein
MVARYKGKQHHDQNKKQALYGIQNEDWPFSASVYR